MVCFLDDAFITSLLYSLHSHIDIFIINIKWSSTSSTWIFSHLQSKRSIFSSGGSTSLVKTFLHIPLSEVIIMRRSFNYFGKGKLVGNHSSFQTPTSKIFHTICNVLNHKNFEPSQNFALELLLDLCPVNSKHH